MQPSPMTVMWISLAGIGLMVISALVITFARMKTKGILRGVLSLAAFAMLVFGFILGVFSIIV
ncbi:MULTISPECIES: DUF2768 family protein [unclassified Paenibacillus]|uniref:DUF2768 family protein n=2 Tax=Paenibacillus TaxID=44249 RepID=UPI0003901F21|nr:MULTISPECIES: DUF2768 family protein [unclassified Paenibacillus]ASS65113.1 DUF2768 family protein [Paenibacillus sp. RUD330]KKC46249.1 hypothetical protein VE23_02555 [Paenibacillus sp. D9]CDN42829.1 Uncharacterized protein BN871_BX_00610 [Paenibacillus sp. P22]SIQ47925.1 Protein of unknown function [Paenibacillus sp. RU4X]SIQ69747.1 Protein of unknown function [Paenibacillus sp. RU4T]